MGTMNSHGFIPDLILYCVVFLIVSMLNLLDGFKGISTGYHLSFPADLEISPAHGAWFARLAFW